MNAFTANGLEAADLLALARLDDDGAPCPAGRQAAPGRTMIAALQRVADPLLPLMTCQRAGTSTRQAVQPASTRRCRPPRPVDRGSPGRAPPAADARLMGSG
ncbi:MAG TPA: hypothetical protein VIV12_03895 [Streptosporangiaceae bacterium]